MNDESTQHLLKEVYGFTDSEIAQYIENRKAEQTMLDNSLSLSIRNTCTWTYCNELMLSGGIPYYKTECDCVVWWCTREILKDYKLKFCHRCGKRIVEEGTKE